MSNSKRLTQEEAEHLLKMLKNTLSDTISFPEKGQSIEFDVVGDTKRDLFTIKIYRGKINRLKYELGARIKKDGIQLLALHINPSAPHVNPDGTKILGSHWHIYTEEYDRRLAYPAEDISSEFFVENTIAFLNEFNVVEKPSIFFQQELV